MPVRLAYGTIAVFLDSYKCAYNVSEATVIKYIINKARCSLQMCSDCN